MTDMSNYHLSDHRNHNRAQQRTQLLDLIARAESELLTNVRPEHVTMVERELKIARLKLAVLEMNDQEYGTMTTCDECGADVLVSSITVTDHGWLCRECVR